MSPSDLLTTCLSVAVYVFDCSFSWLATLIALYYSYIYLSFYPPRQTRSIALRGRSATKKDSRREIEASRSNGMTILYASDDWRNGNDTRVSPHTKRTHAEILRTPIGQTSTVTRYEYSVLVRRRNATSIIRVTLSVSPTRAGKHIDRIINSFDRALMSV